VLEISYIGAISTHGELTRDLEFIGGDKDNQLEKLWAETKIGDILPWDEIADEAERLLEIDQATRRDPDDDQADKKQEDDQEVDWDETDTHMETIFGRRRQDSIAVEWNSKVLYVLEFKRTSDQRRNYRERGEARARAQHDILVKSLEKVAGEAVGENSGLKIKVIIFVGARVDQYMYKLSIIIWKNLGLSSPKETQSERDSCTSYLMHKTRSCAHTLHKDRVRGVRDGAGKVRWGESFQGLDYFE
jgi:hypothetical protein